jgi:hypothetical protein
MSEVAPLGAVLYASSDVPHLYRCGVCGEHGVRLWREYQTFLEHQTLVCAACACFEQSKPSKSYSIELLDTGKVCVTTTYDPHLEPQLHQIFGGKERGGDQIGWRIPAVPTADGESYWGYSSVPKEGVDWWNRLPIAKDNA